MSGKLRESWLILALVAAFGIAGVLTVRAIDRGRMVHAAEGIRPWMSVPYIAHSRHVPQTALWKALGITPHRRDHRPLSRIAKDQKKPVDGLIATLKAAIAASKAEP